MKIWMIVICLFLGLAGIFIYVFDNINEERRAYFVTNLEQSGVRVVIDPQRGVTCYVRDGSGIYCFRGSP